MTVIHLLQHGVQVAAHALLLAHAEDLGDDVRGQAEDAQLAGALEQLVNRDRAAEHEIPTVLDLVEGVGSPQIDRRAVAGGKLRADAAGPVLQAFADVRWTESIRGGMEM